MLIEPLRLNSFSIPYINHVSLFTQSIQKVVFAIFRCLAMALQYLVVGTSIFCRHWKFLPSAIDPKHLKVYCRNIASLGTLRICLQTALHPIPKDDFAQIGKEKGLRITHDLIYQPASGLCLASALAFLSKALRVKGKKDESLFLKAGKTLSQEHNEQIVKIQALYDALIGADIKIPQQELNLLRQALQTARFPLKPERKYHSLWESLAVFLKLEHPSQTLRQYVLNDLENKGEITPILYALTLELDALWQSLAKQDEERYLSIHQAIIQMAAELVELNLLQASHHQGTVDTVYQIIRSLDSGGYLIQFKNHAVAIVKTAELFVLYDRNEGLGIAGIKEQQEAVTRLLNFYGSNNLASIRIYPTNY